MMYKLSELNHAATGMRSNISLAARDFGGPRGKFVKKKKGDGSSEPPPQGPPKAIDTQTQRPLL